MIPLDDFAAIADAFCRWAEADALDGAQELQLARILLAKLYAAALVLPDGTPSEIDPIETPSLSPQKAFCRFGELPINMYATCDPLVVPCEQPGVGDVADDLAGIYADLHRGLVLYRSGDVAAATWEWSFSFRSHWGDHAVGALTALQAFATRT
jgi:hypothetical protein